MRLIDADALKDEMRAGCVPIGLGGITGITGDDDSIEDYIDTAPTIDAIPVQWLEAHKMECDEDWGVVPVSIGKALIMWQKEQEAR